MKSNQKMIVIGIIFILIAFGSFDYYSSYIQKEHKVNTGEIIFTETGIVNKNNWTVKVYGTDYTETKSTNSSELIFLSLEYGTYNYSIIPEFGYKMTQSGETNGNGYSGVVEVGGNNPSATGGNNSYPSQINIALSFEPLTPVISLSALTISSSPADYSLSIDSMSGNISLNYINFTIQNTYGQKFTLILLSALNRIESVGGIWNVSVTGNFYLSLRTNINIQEIKGTMGDANVTTFIAVDTLTGGEFINIPPSPS